MMKHHHRHEGTEEKDASREARGAAPSEAGASSAEIEKMSAKVKELEEFREKFLRQAADFENARKRLVREKEDFVRFANESLLRGILPAIDNLERAAGHTESLVEEGAKALRDGVVLVKKQLLDFLRSQGLERIEAAGKKFDPNYHEAIGHVHSNEHPEETVLDELEAGYIFKGRLLRPARVRISQASERETGAQSPREGGGATTPPEAEEGASPGV